jgi:hypothetical protein
MLLWADCERLAEDHVRVKEYIKLRTKLEKDFRQRFRNKASELGFAHGMIVHVGGPQHWVIEHGGAMLAREPIRSIRLYPAAAATMDRLVAIPGIQRLAYLSIMHATPKQLEALPLDAIPDTKLELAGFGSPHAPGVGAFLDMPQLARVTRLSFWTGPGPDELARYSQDDRLAHLTRSNTTGATRSVRSCCARRGEYLELANTSAALLAKLREKIAQVVDPNDD